ncbi:MAG: D-alanine-D-alanine ligase [Candidatus Peregrinibacteria bacterium GW2011_GWE2_39_6]|nr:MAG: D-alanine-D-alanine ligase [Candidatus Peregrinibacteria bacterium GW2011_GWE2_39_6]
MKILLICGGPSLERGISLNSARSILDHLGDEGIEIVPLYFDHKKRPYRLQVKQLYSNTPSDFDFKLQQTGKFLSSRALKDLFKEVDLAFPVMHGQFGEDGGVQRLLERYRVPYVGSGVEACRRCSDKFEANEFIRSQGFFALPSAVLKIFRNDHEKIINNFFKKHNLKRAIIKPATGGSSIGVFSVGTASEALEKAKLLFSKRMDTRLVLEPFCEGIEFTVILLQNKFGMPVAVLPTEIEADYTEHQIFDFRKKYLPTRQVRYHCPPRFDNNTIERIQVQAEQLFSVLGMRDFARFDGWLLPDGKIWFSDFNPISGMEQNSFLFQQASRIGMSHRNLLRFIVKNNFLVI